MKFRSKPVVAVTVIAFAVQFAVSAQDKSALTNQQQKISYAIGMSVGTSLKRGGLDVDLDIVQQAIKDILAGREAKLSEQQMMEAITEYQKEVRAKRDEARMKTAEKNRKDGEAFLAANKQKPGVKTLSVALPDGKMAELQYKILTQGTGAVASATDNVTFNYKISSIDGKELDDSVKRGQPVRFRANQSPIQGLREVLPMMPVGSKWELYMPSSLAFQDFGSPPNIEPGMTLVYEVELLKAEAPEPLTSDIIKVPSAEELKKGAQIEVIKPEDLKKAQQSNAAPAKR